MQKPSRRNLLKGVAVSGVAVGLGLGSRHGTVEGAPQELQDLEHSTGHGHFPAPAGPMASATVSFGQWTTDPYEPAAGQPAIQLDRFVTGSPNRANVHLLIPYEATIRAGGSVNFIIGGFHLVTIYDDGHQPDQVNANLLVPGTQFIDDPSRRLYRGLNPASLSYVGPVGVRDRVEVVQFPRPGRFLVICGFRPHFVNDNMHGFVRVLP